MEVPQGHEALMMRRPPSSSAQNKPPTNNTRPWPRVGGGGGPSSAPPPPKVYRVEPREFRDLVQKLTGAPPTALRRHQHQQHRAVVAPPPVQPQPVRAAEQQAYGAPSPWFSFPMSSGAVEAQPQQHGAFL